MLKIASYDIVFQEVPDEISLAINISNCPIRCKGCHSPHLMDDIGEPLDKEMIEWLLKQYGESITCICFMGGDSDVKEINRLAYFIHNIPDNKKKTAWYSGRKDIPNEIDIDNFDYIKTGPYIEALGGLKSVTTNQHFFKIKNKSMTDITERFQKK